MHKDAPDSRIPSAKPGDKKDTLIDYMSVSSNLVSKIASKDNVAVVALHKHMGEAMTILGTNLPTIAEKVGRAKAVTSVVKTIEDDKTDTYAEQLIVKIGKTKDEIVALRMQGTKPMDDLKTACMTFEKELIAEDERLRSLRTQYKAAQLKAKKDKEAEIEKDKKFKTHEGEVKAEMKAKLALGIASKITDLEKWIAESFGKVTEVAHIPALEKALNFTPHLKEDYFKGLLDVPYDATIISKEYFTGLKARAEAFFDYAKVNTEYVTQANAVIKKWRDTIPAKKRELEQISKASGEERAKLQQKAQANNQAAVQSIAKKSEELKVTVTTTAAVEKQEAVLNADFDAQVQSQQIGEITGVRQKDVYRLDPAIEKNMLKVSQVIGKLVLNILSEPNNREGIFQRDKGGFVKRHKETGEPLYVDGVQYWLDMASSLGYTPQIEGLIKTTDLTAVNKAKK